MDKIDTLIKMIKATNNIVAFTGAGVSTDSGLKDFRSKDGLYNEDLNAEYMLSSDCFYRHTNEFWDYYRRNFNCLDKKPNITHELLKKLEDKGKLKAIITQNIDGLHTKAGSKNIYEIHGTIYKNYCIKCNKEYTGEYVFKSIDIPRCKCKGLIKPKVTLYGESLPEEEFNKSIRAIKNCDMLIVLGSSLTVYPASGLIDNFKGKYLVIINKDKTSYDYKADLVINESLSAVSKELMKKVDCL